MAEREHGRLRISRRGLLLGGGAGLGLLVAWGVWPRAYPNPLDERPGEEAINEFLRIGEDGRVTVVVPQAEMGQGVWTSLPQILADELGADWRTVGIEPAPISPLYANSFIVEEIAGQMLPAFLKDAGETIAGEIARRSTLMITGGSTSIRGFEQRFRQAGAAARALLCMAAAKRWDIDWQACDTKDGFVIRGEDRLRFGELVAEAAQLDPPDDIPLRAPGEGGLVGKPVPRLDLPAKVDGSLRYAADVRLPGMVYASIRQGPVGDSRLLSVDKKAADAIHGVLAVVENPRWVAAVATNWWAANRALDALAPKFETRGGLADSASVDAALRAALDGGEGGRFHTTGDAEAVIAGKGAFVQEYAVGLAPHAAIEPLTATASAAGDRIQLWAPTQAPAMLRDAVARATGFGAQRVTVHAMPIGGGFGRKVELDAAVQAAVISVQLKRPVQLTWSRGEDMRRGRHRPPALARMSARLGEAGRILGWRAEIATPPTVGAMFARLMPDIPMPSGGAEPAAVEGANPPYAIPAVAIDHKPAAIGIETGIWRSVANSYTAFFTESFIDELARAEGIEPMSYRMQMLGGRPRLARCLTTVSALGNWNGGEPGGGQGIAVHSSFGSHVAMLAEVHVDKSQQIVVDRVVAAVDCGRVIHPDIVRQQIEGGIIWGIAAALGGHTGYTRGLSDVVNFDGLGLPILADAPDITVTILTSNEPAGGVGEIAVPPVAPAIANALFAATGQRARSLPIIVGAEAPEES